MSDNLSDENGLYQFQNLCKWQGTTKKMTSKYFIGMYINLTLNNKTDIQNVTQW